MVNPQSTKERSMEEKKLDLISIISYMVIIILSIIGIIGFEVYEAYILTGILALIGLINRIRKKFKGTLVVSSLQILFNVYLPLVNPRDILMLIWAVLIILLSIAIIIVSYLKNKEQKTPHTERLYL